MEIELLEPHWGFSNYRGPTPALRADPPPNGEGWFPLTDQWDELGNVIDLLEPPWGFRYHSEGDEVSVANLFPS